MVVCEFCTQYEQGGTCRLGLRIPKGMGCRVFDPAMNSFCSDPKDYVSPGQIIEIATFFGIKGRELKKVRIMAEQEESFRSQPGHPAPPTPETHRIARPKTESKSHTVADCFISRGGTVGPNQEKVW